MKTYKWWQKEKKEREHAQSRAESLEESLMKTKKIILILLFAVAVLAVTVGIFIHNDGSPIQITSHKDAETPTEQLETEKATEVPQEQENAPTGQIQPYNVTVNQNGVNVRQMPDVNSQTLGQVNANDVVVANGEPQNGWQEVTWCEQTAYISQQYLNYPEKAQEEEKVGVWKSIKDSFREFWYIYAIGAFMIFCFISGLKRKGY